MSLPEEVYGSVFQFLPIENSELIFSSVPELSKSILIHYPFLFKKPDSFYCFNDLNIRLLLRNCNIDRNVLLMHTAKRGLIWAVRVLISDKKVDPCTNNNYAITRASEYGHYDVVKLLLKVPNINPILSLEKAFQNKHFEITKILFTHPKILDNTQSLVLAAKSGNVDAVKFLLTKKVNVDIKIRAFIGSCEYGHHEIASILYFTILEIGTEIKTIAIHKAIYNKHYQVVMFLLNVNIEVDKKSIIIAASRGYTKIMELLISNGNKNYGDAIYESTKRGYYKMTKLLLIESILDSNLEKDIIKSLYRASEKGYYKIVSLFLPLVDLNSKHHSLICGVENGHYEVVKIILKEPEIDINYQDGRALRRAISKDYTDIINILTSSTSYSHR